MLTLATDAPKGFWWVVHSIMCGIHSGIPPCCILWYLTGWILVRRLRLNEFWSDHGYTGEGDFISCPACSVREVVMTKDCSCFYYHTDQ